MKALVLTAPSQLEYTDVEDPVCGSDEVVVRIRACGICGSDIHGWDGSSGRRRPPLIMGHEAAGEIVSVGAAVKGWSAGDRVAFDSTIYCGKCPFCEAGEINLCFNRRVVGVAPPEYRQNGAFAEFLALPARILHELPSELDFVQAAFVEPTAIAVHAVRRAGITKGSSTVVVGSGMIGLLVIQALRWAGASRIIAIDRVAERLAIARELGATDTLEGSADTPNAVAALTGGDGADAVFEVVGIGPTLNLALCCARRGGTCVLVGNLQQATSDFPLQSVVTREITIRGSCASAGEYRLCLDLIASSVIQTGPLTSAVAPLRDGVEWFRTLSGPTGGQYLKVILQP
jgi:L-iditol 2-dehydrogenase